MLLLFVVANFAVAGIGARLGERGQGTEAWFGGLRKPTKFPSSAVFGPAWALVLIATGVAGWWLWREAQLSYSSTALVLYGFALVFNAVWQGVSIGLRRLGLGVAVGWLLWATIALTAWADWAQGDTTRWHLLWLLPYWLWVGLCLRWNHGLWRANRAGPGAESMPPPDSGYVDWPGKQVS